MQQDSSSSASDDGGGDDDELLTAAAAWAGRSQDDEEDSDGDGEVSASKKPSSIKGRQESLEQRTRSSKNDKGSGASEHSNSQRKNFSLHLTKIPYEATQGDIRFAFGEKGCNVTSVRLVYDRDHKTGERHFRGVAFVDVADEKSFNKGLEFHNKSFLGKGRRVNVRPTRTKSELSEIVRKTEEKVANLIARSKEKAQAKKRDGDGDGADAQEKRKGDNRGKGKNNKKRKRTDDAPKKDTPAKAPKRKGGSSNDKNGTPGKDSKGKGKPEASGEPTKSKKAKFKHKKGAKSESSPPEKLTKKQRAKKAAVIRMMRLKS